MLLAARCATARVADLELVIVAQREVCVVFCWVKFFSRFEMKWSGWRHGGSYNIKGFVGGCKLMTRGRVLETLHCSFRVAHSTACGSRQRGASWSNLEGEQF